MSKICTTIEQSKKLIELGIYVNTADMYWDYDYDIQQGFKYYLMVMDEQFDDVCIPAWSLTALLGLIPDKISINNKFYYPSFDKKSIAFKGSITWDGQKSISFEMDNLIDAAFEMVCWLKENGKL